ncbi:MAG TPA: thioredoxin domain-containing protein [Acidisarcina sp.]|nr:thioredoxin domain-containing protein [Acidisarcina sp.]
MSEGEKQHNSAVGNSPVHPSNALQHAASSYLRSAMHQPVRWHQWGEEAFALAASTGKPILLDIGAVWCHWCHVMDRESYEDAQLAGVINEHFIAIKVDRDERPDVDSRYQAAVSAISGQGGWPLTAILTPDGRPFFGGTYFPREDRYGRPGFERVLRTMAGAWETRREEALESAASVMEAIEHGESFAGRRGQLSLSLVEKLVASAVTQFDSRYGGFGSQPKFPHPAALDLLLDVASRTGNEETKRAAVFTLECMAKGGVYDQIAGGFHRYSVDERWVVPHFEKMLYDNAGLLGNYVHAFQSFVDPALAGVAKDIMRWMNECLSDQQHGGFYASQDADITLDDDGDYFTWTRAEAEAVLSPDEFAIAAIYYDIGEVGDMHHNPAKNVLHRRLTLEETAARAKIAASEAKGLLESAKQKLYEARMLRPAPFIDRTIYTGWNALAVSAYLDAAQVLSLSAPRGFALRTLDRILAEGWDKTTGLAHVIAYPDAAPGPRIAGVLDDYAFLALACTDAWMASGDLRYYQAAVEIADAMIARFYDRIGNGFFDAEATAEGQKALGALSARRKPLQDSPTPAGNSAAAAALLRLEALSGREEYREIAEDTLESFAGVVEHFGLYVGMYGLALERLMLDPIQVVVVGEDLLARQLQVTATARYAVNKSVLHLRRDQLRAETLPPMLAETLPNLPQVEGSFAIVCKGRTCLPPLTSPEALLEALSPHQ